MILSRVTFTRFWSAKTGSPLTEVRRQGGARAIIFLHFRQGHCADQSTICKLQALCACPCDVFECEGECE